MKSKEQIQKRIEELTLLMDCEYDSNDDYSIELAGLFASEIHALEWVLNEA